jgi:hypothetical protein
VFGRKAFYFKLLSELSLNSGYDHLTPGLVYHRPESLPCHYADRPFSHGFLNLLQPADQVKPTLFMIQGGRPAGHVWFICVHQRLTFGSRRRALGDARYGLPRGEP